MQTGNFPISIKNCRDIFPMHLGRCIYEGLYVGEDSEIPNVNGMRTDVVEALKQIKVPVLRWPGGCFADEYHWKDGIGPKEGRKKIVNTHWGGVVEDNSFGTHEFFELCRQLGCGNIHQRQHGKRNRSGDVRMGRIHDLRGRIPDGRSENKKRSQRSLDR